MTDRALEPVEEDPGDPKYISYAEFGHRFFELAVTRDRIEQAVSSVGGRPVDVGPFAVGPLGLIKVRANGHVGTPTVRDRAGEHVSFDLCVPITLAMLIEIGFDKNRFDALVEARLVVNARAADPLRVVIDVEPPSRRNIHVQVKADGLRASVVQIFGGVNGELKRTVVKAIRDELAKPAARRARVIDIARTLERLSTTPTAARADG